MKTPDSLDSLDRKIDELFASQPLKPSADFTNRVLAATDEFVAKKSPSRTIRPWLRLALPIAALLVAALTLTQLLSTKPVASESSTLITIDLQEIFILEEGLTGIADLQDDDLSNADFLDALIFFNSETQS